MDLQISLFLLFALFTAGYSLNCYLCSTGSCSQISCPVTMTNCYALTAYVGSIKTQSKGCLLPGYPSGSLNLGNISLSSYSCTTDLCNNLDAPDPSSNPLNGNMCYSCAGQNCSTTLNCSGPEDHCCTATANTGSQTMVYKGCVSKSFCDAGIAMSGLSNVTCCAGNLCNGAHRFIQSFLILGCSVLSFILIS